MTTSFYLRFSLGVLVGSVLLHVALAYLVVPSSALLFAAPSLVLAATAGVMRRKWIVWLALAAVSFVEACCVGAYLFSEPATRSLIVMAFAIAASAVQIPIAALVAAVRYFQSAE